jgi:hypothetical protein
VTLRVALTLALARTQPVNGVGDEDTRLQSPFEKLNNVRLHPQAVGWREQMGFEDRLDFRDLTLIEWFATIPLLNALRVGREAFEQAVFLDHLVSRVKEIEPRATDHDLGWLTGPHQGRSISRSCLPLHEPEDQRVIFKGASICR